jgi:hypothetical protein
MRLALIALVTVAAGLTADIRTAATQARASRTAIDARQEPSAQSLVMNLILRRIVWSDCTSRPDDYDR